MERVIIVGAGPYGLSVAAHLEAVGIPYRIFGRPLATWREHMPQGMLLKSEGYASNLSAPAAGAGSRLKDFCRTRGLPYRDINFPVPLEMFIDYAMAFQKRFVPKLEPTHIASIEHNGTKFFIDLEDRERIAARYLVLATGITWFHRVPTVFANISPDLVSHSYEHRTAERFAGKQVIVLGAGASAADTAVLLSDSGADVQILARSSHIRFHYPPPAGGRTLVQKMSHPQTVIGPGWRSKLFTTFPSAFRHLPASLRSRIVRRHLGPAPGWFTRERIDGRIPVSLDAHVQSAIAKDGRIELQLLKADGSQSAVTVDHVIAATGYTVDLRRIEVLSHALRGWLAHYEHSPLLSDNFESSVPNLYFAGPAAAHAFGPLMRFIVGAEWLAPRLAGHLARMLGSRH